MIFFGCCRHSAGLVGPRTVVALAQRVAIAHALDAGPVRRPGRRPALLHAHAQDAARPAARSALPRLPRRFQRQNLQRRRHPLQRIG